MSQPICTVMVGLPAMGKTTLVNFERQVYDAIDESFYLYSTDNLIEEWAASQGWTYDFAFEKYIDKAAKEAELGLIEAIRNKQDVIWDQTNLGVGKRRKIINRMKQAGYQVRCKCIIPPEEGHISDLKDWKYRLANRPGKTIPDEVLSNMYLSFTMPSMKEGFDTITFYTMQGALIGIDLGEDNEP